MEFSCEGIGQVVATFTMWGELEPGMAVAVVDNMMVGKGADGTAPCGVVLQVEDDCCAVQVGGFVKVSYVGEALATGMDFIALDGKGAVQRYGAAGVKCLIAQVDEETQTAIVKF